MLIASKCLHRAVAEEYAEVCRTDSLFEDFLMDVLPNLNMRVCSNCQSCNPCCGGELSEYHSDPDSFILNLEKVRLGLGEDPNYGPTGMTKRGGPIGSYTCSSGSSISLRNAIPVDLELLTGDPAIDRVQVEDALSRRGNHSSDEYTLKEQFEEGILV